MSTRHILAIGSLVIGPCALAWVACGGSGSSETSDAGSSSSGGPDSGTDASFDALTPDAFADCAWSLVLDPDAAPNTCAVTPADVACNTNADCTSFVRNMCSCPVPIYGVNTANTVLCIPPPCVLLPPGDGGCQGPYETQDCKVTQNVAVACVNHQCMTYAPGL